MAPALSVSVPSGSHGIAENVARGQARGPDMKRLARLTTVHALSKIASLAAFALVIYGHRWS